MLFLMSLMTLKAWLTVEDWKHDRWPTRATNIGLIATLAMLVLALAYSAGGDS